MSLSTDYRITGKFGDLASLQQFAKFKIAKHCSIALRLCDRVKVVAKLKTRQYVHKTDSPNLNLAHICIRMYTCTCSVRAVVDRVEVLLDKVNR